MSAKAIAAVQARDRHDAKVYFEALEQQRKPILQRISALGHRVYAAFRRWWQ
jgi:hypothetical protein